MFCYTEIVSCFSEIVSCCSETISFCTEFESLPTEIVSCCSEIVSYSSEIVSYSSEIVSYSSEIISSCSETQSSKTEIQSSRSEIESSRSETVKRCSRIVIFQRRGPDSTGKGPGGFDSTGLGGGLNPVESARGAASEWQSSGFPEPDRLPHSRGRTPATSATLAAASASLRLRCFWRKIA